MVIAKTEMAVSSKEKSKKYMKNKMIIVIKTSIRKLISKNLIDFMSILKNQTHLDGMKLAGDFLTQCGQKNNLF